MKLCGSGELVDIDDEETPAPALYAFVRTVGDLELDAQIYIYAEALPVPAAMVGSICRNLHIDFTDLLERCQRE